MRFKSGWNLTGLHVTDIIYSTVRSAIVKKSVGVSINHNIHNQSNFKIMSCDSSVSHSTDYSCFGTPRTIVALLVAHLHISSRERKSRRVRRDEEEK